jgi:regulator of RNase E activity RraA
MAADSFNASTKRILQRLQEEQGNMEHHEQHRELLADAATIIRDLSDNSIVLMTTTGEHIATIEEPDSQTIIEAAVRGFIIDALQRAIDATETQGLA